MREPRNAKGLRLLASEHGWETESVGQEFYFILRFTRAGHKLAALWYDGKEGFQGAYAHPHAPRWPMIVFNFNQLKQVLAIPADDFEYPSVVEEVDDVRENMRWELEYLGTYLSGHPLDFVNMRKYPDVMLGSEFEPDMVQPDGRVQALGLIDELDKKVSRHGNPWARFLITDLTGAFRCLAFGKVVNHLSAGTLVHVHGKVELRDEELTLIVNRVTEVSW
jgi:OB-fold nucleic acid binding domain